MQSCFGCTAFFMHGLVHTGHLPKSWNDLSLQVQWMSSFLSAALQIFYLTQHRKCDEFSAASEVNIRYHNYSLLESGTMLLLDTLLLSILFLYLDQVMPREAEWRSGGGFGRLTFTDVMELNRKHPMVLNEMFRQCGSNAVKPDRKLN